MLLCCRSHSPRTPDSAWSWLVCFSGCLSLALVYGMSNCFGVVLPVFMEHFLENRERTAWAGSIAKGVGYFCMPLSAMVMTRLKIRYTAILGTLMCITSLVATSFTTNIVQVFFSYGVLYGMGYSLVYNSCIFATTKYFDKREAIAIGILSGGGFIGLLSLGPIVQLLIDLYGFRTMYRIMAGSFVLVLVAVCSFDPNVKATELDHIQHRDNADNQDKWKWSEVLEIFKRPMYVVAVIVIILQVMGGYVWLIHLVNYCREVGISADKASNLYIVIGVSSLITSIVAGRVMDHKRVNPFHVNQAGALCMVLATILLLVSSRYIIFVCFSALLGVFYGILQTTLVVLFLKTVELRLGLYSFPIGSLLTAMADFTAPPLIGFIADTTGSYKPAFYTTGAILLLSFFLPFLQYCFKPWRTLELEGHVQATQIETNESRENKDVQDNRVENIALEMMDEKRTGDDSEMPTSYVNQAIDGDDVTEQDNCHKATDIECGNDNEVFQSETAIQDDGFETRL